MPKYRKKPVVVEAFQHDTSKWEGDETRTWPRWMLSAVAENKIVGRGNDLVIKTLEGDMRANPGDWIIKGVKGEFYPCKPDIFEATYEAVEE